MPEGKIKSITVSMLALCTIILNSCNALRENPLDPNSEDNILGSISGTVQTYSLPYTPIAGVEVYWRSGNILVLTDTAGNFTISNVKTENGPLIFRKEGFHSDTIQVNWKGTKKVDELVNLNSFPALDSLSIYTVVVNVADTTEQMYQLVISIKVRDLDNDIDTVFVVNSKVGLNKAMDFNIANKKYQSILTLEDLNLNNIEETVGLVFNFRVKNILGDVYTLDGGSVTRVIKDRISGLQPDSNHVITSFPFKLYWGSFSPGYSFHYMVEIYTNDVANPQLVLRQSDISSQDTSFIVSNLDTGEYWWVIWVIDDFNNMSRSAPATFIIQ
jgi:hypothetical protein